MATSKPRLIRNDLVTDADLARFQHVSASDGDHDPCPVADKALLLDARSARRTALPALASPARAVSITYRSARVATEW
jgi:hypothetical protein